MVRRDRELTPAHHTCGLASKKAKTTTVAGPRLARGRSENLIRTRSCTPSDEDTELIEAAETPSTFTESNVAYNPSSPTSGRLSSVLSFSPTAFSPPTNPRSQDGDLGRRMSQDWVMASADEEDERGRTALAGLLHQEQPQIIYAFRTNDVHPSPSPATQVTPSTIASPLATSPSSAFININRRPSEPGYRPLASRPPNYRPTPVVEKSSDAPARTANGKNKGVKKPYKSQEERDKVKAVRNHGACLRCQIMRQACQVTEPGEPCANCLVPRRKFRIQCTRDGPSPRYNYLFPEIVTSRHETCNRKAIIGKDMPGMFRITLTHASGFTLNLQVVEDRSIADSELTNSYFKEEGEGRNKVQKLAQDRSAPLVPVITTSFVDVANWITQQIQMTQASLFVDLPTKVFPKNKGQDWPRSVMVLFQEFNNSVYLSRRILKIFKTTIVRHLMSRQFYIPFDQMWEVNEKLSEKYQESDEELQERRETQRCMVPKFINNYLKAALMHLLRESFKGDFEELEKMFKLYEKSPGCDITDLDRDEALCYVAMVLILVAIMQIKIMQVAKARDTESSYNCPLGLQTQAVDSAKQILQRIETEVIDHILGLFAYKFVKSNRKGSLMPEHSDAARQAKDFNLLERFKKTKEDHDDILSSYTDLTLNLDDSHIPRFLVDNSTRVLLRFAETLSPSKPRRSQPQ